MAASCIFVLPALVMVGYWDGFKFYEVAMIGILGGVLGVMFSIPLRRNMIEESKLPYPEGVAVAHVLQMKKGSSIKSLGLGAIISSVSILFQNAFKISSESIGSFFKIGSGICFAGFNFSPIILAAGYIVGIEIALCFIFGSCISSFILMPYCSLSYDIPTSYTTQEAGSFIFKNYIRFAGVGMLTIGGLWNLCKLLPQIAKAIKDAIASIKFSSNSLKKEVHQDVPFKYVLMVTLAIGVVLSCLFGTMIYNIDLDMTYFGMINAGILTTLLIIIFGFVAATISAYITGLAGTTSLPLSGIVIASILFFGLPFVFILKTFFDLSYSPMAIIKLSSIIIIFGAIIATIASLSGDNMQDLKSGHIVGATPWKQELVLIVGVITSACVIPFALEMLYQGYGIGDALPNPQMDPTKSLAAPQATLVATIAKGIALREMEWGMVNLGIFLGTLVIIIDFVLEKLKSVFRFPVLAVALGLYLPMGYLSIFFVGALVKSLVKHLKSKKNEKMNDGASPDLLFAAGIITGESLSGAILAIPFMIYQSSDIFNLKIPFFQKNQIFMAIILISSIIFMLYKFGMKKKEPSEV